MKYFSVRVCFVLGAVDGVFLFTVFTCNQTDVAFNSSVVRILLLFSKLQHIWKCELESLIIYKLFIIRHHGL